MIGEYRLRGSSLWLRQSQGLRYPEGTSFFHSQLDAVADTLKSYAPLALPPWRTLQPRGRFVLDISLGMSRRSFLRVGGLGALSLPILLRNETQGATHARAKSVLLVYLGGGLSHHDS